eukprot:1863345-Amphidinium_carterae.1
MSLSVLLLRRDLDRTRKSGAPIASSQSMTDHFDEKYSEIVHLVEGFELCANNRREHEPLRTFYENIGSSSL